ncbi:hypothetical protein [Rodentibacter rarus]|uniref:hypothetical protein n=1 Tax=Rodentibacter rarus TaxID=1908260 RepID=UPI0013012291|nr:hypothetical protein [Rodentibacter rarus]
MKTFVALLAFAESRSDFEKKIDLFWQKHHIIAHLHLVPIPLIFFQRHGRLSL